MYLLFYSTIVASSIFEPTQGGQRLPQHAFSGKPVLVITYGLIS
jgi:hypothetical protein